MHSLSRSKDYECCAEVTTKTVQEPGSMIATAEPNQGRPASYEAHDTRTGPGAGAGRHQRWTVQRVSVKHVAARYLKQ